MSKNGCLLLNVGPKPDGTIPEEAQKVLLAMGAWLKINGDAIYGTRPWKVSGEGPTKVVGGSFKDTAGTPFTGEDIRFTAKGNTLYAIALAWPRMGSSAIKSLAAGSPNAAGKIKSVRLLGYRGRLTWKQNADGLVIDMPGEKSGNYAAAFKILQ